MKLSSVLLITIAASEQSLAWIGGRVMSTSSNVRDGKKHLAKKMCYQAQRRHHFEVVGLPWR